MFDGADVRGAVVSLDASWREVLLRRRYPQSVRSLLGEAYAAAALLGSTLKFRGSLALQTQAANTGASVRLMVVECNAGLCMRAMAKLGAGVAGDVGAPTLPELIGDGKLVITLDPQDGQAPYQGVVPLTGDRLNLALEHYMLHSEQLDTRIWLAADETRAVGVLIQRVPDAGGATGAPSRWVDAELLAATIRSAELLDTRIWLAADETRAAGVLIQRVPDAAGATGAPSAAASRWVDAELLAATIRSAELLALAPHQLLRRLFHEYDLRVFEARTARFTCSCSRERVAGMLRMLGRDEVGSLLAERGEVKVDCEFCNQAYAFDAVDAAQLFIPPAGDVPVARH